MYFNRKARSFLIALLAVILLCLASCAGPSNGGEGESSFDYFAADMSEYISLDTSVCKNMSVTISSQYRVDDKAVDDYINRTVMSKKKVLNDGAAVYDQPIKLGDTAHIYYRGLKDGKEFEGGSNMDSKAPYALSIGSGSFIPGFEDGLVGVVPNTTSKENPVRLNLTFPEDYGGDLSGADVVFEVYVEYLVQYEIPEYNEDFIINTLGFDAKGDNVMAEYELHVYNTLEAEVAQYKQGAIENAIWSQLFSAAKVLKYPEGEVEREFDLRLEEINEMKSYYESQGYTFDSVDDFACQYLSLAEGTQWRENLRKTSEQHITQKLIYHAISQFDNRPLTDEAINEEIDFYINYYQDNANTVYTKEQIISMFGEDAIRDGALGYMIIGELIENCEVIYK